MKDAAAQLRDLHSRATRLLEALRNGDLEFLERALDDLAADIGELVEIEERAA